MLHSTFYCKALVLAQAPVVKATTVILAAWTFGRLLAVAL
jgi:hypothetical protein